jgi:hypothetical protein
MLSISPHGRQHHFQPGGRCLTNVSQCASGRYSAVASDRRTAPCSRKHFVHDGVFDFKPAWVGVLLGRTESGRTALADTREDIAKLKLHCHAIVAEGSDGKPSTENGTARKSRAGSG